MEVWKSVVGYEGLYEVSDLGRVKTLKRSYTSTFGTVNLKEKIRVLSLLPNGYLQLTLHKNGSKTHFLAHRLVALSFIPNPENKPCVNHKNGIRNDNRIENLEWVTSKENIHHAINFGNQNNVGENHPMVKLNESQVFDIKYNLGHLPNMEVAKKFNVSRDIIWRIRRGLNWTHI